VGIFLTSHEAYTRDWFFYILIKASNSVVILSICEPTE